MISKSSVENLRKYFIFFIFLAIGLSIYKDYGFNIDEKFHRSNGFYWLRYIADFFGLTELSILANDKLASIQGFTLSPIDYYNKYGIVFDVPAAIVEILLKLEHPIDYYQARHFLIFLYFFTSLIFLYKILLNRFNSDYIAIFGVLLLFITPRVFGDSFQNNKDIIFLSFTIISTYFCFKILENNKKRNIFLFCFFSAIATSLRLFGVFLPISLIVIQLLLVKKENYKTHINNVLLIASSFIISLILVWPLLWENSLSNFLGYFKILDDYFNAKVFFGGSYYESDRLPYYYLPFWMLISTPVLHLLLFFHGFFIVTKRFFSRLINFNENNLYPDFWRGKNEMKDFFILFNFLAVFFGLIFFNIKLYNSWRIGYFLYFFIIYFCIYDLNFLFNKKKINRTKRIYLNLILIFFIIFTSFRIILYHPYQSFYFNALVPKIVKDNVEVDYTGLSSIRFLNEVLNEESKNMKIKVGVASWYPIWRMLELLDERKINNVEIVAIRQNHTADLLYTNRISEVDKRYNKKYDIPSNFKKYKELNIDGATIYEVYKKIK